ncbi:DUF4282 domain-containing protein [Acinetobacter baumannii]|uniref:DUF4282 domain-containing protein n=2 Tax=Acinetobacter TaxID=469 RepID=UPI003261B1E1
MIRGKMKNILFLDAVLSTKIVTFAYWILLLCVWVIGITMIIGGSSGSNLPSEIANPYTSGSLGIFTGVCILVFGSVMVRLWAEFWVVIFKIQQNTRRTADLLERLSKDRSSPL